MEKYFFNKSTSILLILWSALFILHDNLSGMQRSAEKTSYASIYREELRAESSEAESLEESSSDSSDDEASDSYASFLAFGLKHRPGTLAGGVITLGGMGTAAAAFFFHATPVGAATLFGVLAYWSLLKKYRLSHAQACILKLLENGAEMEEKKLKRELQLVPSVELAIDQLKKSGFICTRTAASRTFYRLKS